MKKNKYCNRLGVSLLCVVAISTLQNVCLIFGSNKLKPLLCARKNSFDTVFRQY